MTEQIFLKLGFFRRRETHSHGQSIEKTSVLVHGVSSFVSPMQVCAVLYGD
jgi:hypothetical protein